MVEPGANLNSRHSLPTAQSVGSVTDQPINSTISIPFNGMERTYQHLIVYVQLARAATSVEAIEHVVGVEEDRP